MNAKDKILEIAGSRIIVLDGGTGSSLPQPKGRPLLPDLQSIYYPEAVGKIHTAFLRAAADIIATNTINSNSLTGSIISNKVDINRLNKNAVNIARKFIDEFNSSGNCFCAGSVGPTRLNLKTGNKKSSEYRNLVGIYSGQIEALLDAGIDILLFETMINFPNIEAAFDAAEQMFERSGKEIPIWLSVAPIIKGGRILSGENILEIISRIESRHLLIIGINCIDDFESAENILETLKYQNNLLVSFHPNAGIPDRQGRYPMSMRDWAERMIDLCRKGLINIAGGCCGITPEYIGLLADRLKNISPRKINWS